MRLNEFTDPSAYTLIDADTEDLLEQIDTFLPAGIADDDSPPQLRPKRSQIDRAKLSDER
jgi:hypothetical protein